MWYLGLQVKVNDILGKLDMVYEALASFDILMKSFYKISQEKSEKIPAYATHIEGALNQLRLKYPDRLSDIVMEGHLRERFLSTE